MIDTSAAPRVNQAKDPRPIRVINWLANTAQRFGVKLADLSEASILKSAQRKTGLSDWGSQEFRQPFAILLKSLENEANLSPLGRFYFHRMCFQGVVNRLNIQADLKRHPEIADVPIHRPLFIVGWPRTGTTLLHNLLSLHPASRTLRYWELVEPSPPPRAETEHTDPRIAEQRRRLERLHRFAPELSSIHSTNAESPEECALLLRNAFTVDFDEQVDVPSYSRWLHAADMTEPYRYYRRQLQLLTWQTPGRNLVLKAPQHLASLDAVLRVFPDACIVHTHRHPLKSLPSACSLASFGARYLTRELDLPKLGDKLTGMFARGIQHALDCRDKADAAQFHDVPYQRLLCNPQGTVRGIFEHFGFDVPRDMDARIRRWLGEHPQNKHGVHRYTLEQFGLDEQGVNRRFADYLERYPLAIA